MENSTIFFIVLLVILVVFTVMAPFVEFRWKGPARSNFRILYALVTLLVFGVCFW